MAQQPLSIEIVFGIIEQMPRKLPELLPDVFDSLAAICKFIAVPQIDPVFHKRHHHAIEMASSFLRVLASNYPMLEKAFRASLPLPITDGSKHIRQVMPELGMSEERLQWLDAQMTEILKVLIPVVRDAELPSWLSECKWAVEGAFER